MEESPTYEWLQARYERLFDIYGAGVSRPVVRTKQRIARFMEDNPESLRPDAAYFLLVNFDEMVIRPNAGYVPGFEFREAPEGWPQTDISERVDKSLEVIFESLGEGGEPPISAHEVMLVIHQNWDTISEIIEWA